MKNNIFLLLLFFPFLVTCEKDTPETPIGLSSKILITTGSATDIGYTTATISGIIGNTSGHTVKDYGHCWDTLPNPEINSNLFSFGSTNTDKSFASELDNLKPGKKYYTRAFFTINDITKYSEPVSFSTFALGLPVVATDSATDIKALTARCGGTVTADGGSEVTAYGLCWNIKGNPTVIDNKTVNGTGTGIFTHLLSGLSKNTLYYVRVYATNSFGTSYGNEISFITKDGLPDIITTEVTNITAITAASGGSIADDEGYTITARGVCWNDSANPSTANAKTSNGSGTGTFVSELSDLQPGEVIYLRAYATNSMGTSYGNQVQFVTDDGIPDLTTTNASNITAVTAVSGGNITSDGGLPVTARGICWSKTTNPTIANHKTSNGAGKGAFSSNLTDLEKNTTYYIRSYAITQVDTVYGNQVVFKTRDGLPSITTNSITNVSSSSADCGGNITDDGGFSVIERGLCYAGSPNPTITGNKITQGAGTGSFASSITDLEPNTTYYVRAYAMNQQGTVYGTERSFTTLTPPGPFIEFLKYEMIYDANLDRIVNKGENVDMKIFLKNTGIEKADEVKAVLSTMDQYVTSLDPSASILFNNQSSSLDYIDAGESRWGYGNLRNYNYHGDYVTYTCDFVLLNTVPDNHYITFNLDITDKNSNNWTDTFNVQVKPTNAIIEFQKFEVTKDYGNGDNIINPGERILAKVYLKNSGTSQANKVRAIISNTSPYIYDFKPTSKLSYQGGGTGNYIAPGEIRYSYDHYASPEGYEVTCEFKNLPSTPLNTEITFNLDIEDESMNTWTDSFTVIVQ